MILVQNPWPALGNDWPSLGRPEHFWNICWLKKRPNENRLLVKQCNSTLWVTEQPAGLGVYFWTATVHFPSICRKGGLRWTRREPAVWHFKLGQAGSSWLASPKTAASQVNITKSTFHSAGWDDGNGPAGRLQCFRSSGWFLFSSFCIKAPAAWASLCF